MPRNRAMPRSRIGEALGYLRNQWSALTRYLGDPKLPIDNAQSEQIIRPLTVGRNNWQFLGHPQAAAGRLQLYSVVSSPHRHHLVIDDYLEDVFRKLADAQQNHPTDLELGSSYLADLLPDRWALTHPRSVRRIAPKIGRWSSRKAPQTCEGPDVGPRQQGGPIAAAPRRRSVSSALAVPFHAICRTRTLSL